MTALLRLAPKVLLRSTSLSPGSPRRVGPCSSGVRLGSSSHSFAFTTPLGGVKRVAPQPHPPACGWSPSSSADHQRGAFWFTRHEVGYRGTRLGLRLLAVEAGGEPRGSRGMRITQFFQKRCTGDAPGSGAAAPCSETAGQGSSPGRAELKDAERPAKQQKAGEDMPRKGRGDAAQGTSAEGEEGGLNPRQKQPRPSGLTNRTPLEAALAAAATAKVPSSMGRAGQAPQRASIAPAPATATASSSDCAGSEAMQPGNPEPAKVATNTSPSLAPSSSAYPELASLLREPSWQEALQGELSKPYMTKLHRFLCAEVAAGKAVYPPPHLVFNALNSCPLSQVRLVIIGQDPYHGPGQAMGLSFSVPKGVPPPSSLQNIFKELQQDLGCKPPGHGDLTLWAKRGVLLLNTVLTVRRSEPNSHAKQGWETLTDAAIRAVVTHCTSTASVSSAPAFFQRKPGGGGASGPGVTDGDSNADADAGDGSRKKMRRSRPRPVVFLLWGAHAQSKAKLLPPELSPFILKCPHPSGLSAHRGFFGCRHFSAANKLLEENGEMPIEWSLI